MAPGPSSRRPASAGRVAGELEGEAAGEGQLEHAARAVADEADPVEHQGGADHVGIRAGRDVSRARARLRRHDRGLERGAVIGYAVADGAEVSNVHHGGEMLAKRARGCRSAGVTS